MILCEFKDKKVLPNHGQKTRPSFNYQEKIYGYFLDLAVSAGHILKVLLKAGQIPKPC